MLLVLPMVAIALGAFATTVYVPREVHDKVSQNSVKEQLSEGSIIRITSDKIFLDDKQVSLNELKGALADYFADVKAVTIKADMDVNMGSIADVKNVLRGVNGLKINYQSAEPEQVTIEQDQTSDKLDKKPTFQGGGVEKFAVWVQSNVKYPAEAVEKNIQGRVMFSFTVNKDGSVGSFKVLQSPHDLLSKEVERVFNIAPKWEPGVVDGKKVPVKYIIPVVFKFDVAKKADDVANQSTPEDKQPAVVIDGKEVAYKKMKKLDPNDIDHIDVVKSHGENGTIYIATKKKEQKPTIVIGGMEVPEHQLELLDPAQISSISVVNSGGGTTIYVNTAE